MAKTKRENEMKLNDAFGFLFDSGFVYAASSSSSNSWIGE